MQPMLTNGPECRFVRRFCELYIQKLRALLARNLPKDVPCSTCAFAPKTDSWEGFEATIWGLIQAVMHRREFYCHRNMESVDGEYKIDLTKALPCAGYEAIRHCPEALDAIQEAAVESEPMQNIASGMLGTEVRLR